MKIETAVQREEKIKDLARRITGYCRDFYERASDEQKEKLFSLLESLEQAMIRYRKYDEAWDSKLIDSFGIIPAANGNQEVRYKSKEFSTFESVMDKAREVFAFVSTGSAA